MNALTQYIDLYRAQQSVVNAHAPEALNRRRAAALAALEGMERLPRKGDEGFAAVSLEDMFAPDYGINIARVPFAANERAEFSCDVPIISTASALVVNDEFVPTASLAKALPEGVEVMSLARAAETYPELFAEPVEPRDNPIVALNTLFVQDGVFIRVKRGVRAERPVQLLSIFNAAAPLMAARRIKIIVEDGAQASVLSCDHPRVNDFDYLSCRVVEVTLGTDARLDFYDLEEASPRTARASVLTASMDTGSMLNATGIYLNGGTTRNEYYAPLRRPGAQVRLGGMVIAGSGQRVDNATFITHDSPRCISRQLFKYALFDDAEGAFEGLVTVCPGADNTDARQTNRNLLASPQARMHAEPQLIINCDEVKASHGATTGQIDEKALFYMRSRGIPEAEARMMLINAFMTDVLDHIELPALRERLRLLTDRRLRGCESTCRDCGIKTERGEA